MAIRTRYRDGNMSIAPTVYADGKSITVIGTAADGPMHQPVRVSDETSARQMFGDSTEGTLVRMIDEIMSVPGTKRIFAIRIGNGKRAYLELNEISSRTGMYSPTTSDDGSEVSPAIRIEAKYPGNVWNDCAVSIEAGNIFIFRNFKTETEVEIPFDTDPDVTTVNVHNVSELAATLNADPNFSPYFIARVVNLRSRYEMNVLPITSDPSYGEEGLGYSWKEILEGADDRDPGLLPSEWSDGVVWDGYNLRIKLEDRLVDSETGDDSISEHPRSSHKGWEIMSKGFVTGGGPLRPIETAVNNIARFNQLYSVGYIGPKALVSDEWGVFEVKDEPFNTYGNRGYTTGAINAYKADGFNMQKPNAEPVNEADPSYESTSGWASEYAIWVNSRSITGGKVGRGNDGSMEFSLFLPLDLSGMPRYWARKIYPTIENNIDRIAIGLPYAKKTSVSHDGYSCSVELHHDGTDYYSYDSVGSDFGESVTEDPTTTSRMYSMVDGSVVTPEALEHVVAKDSPDGGGAPVDIVRLYYPGVTREGVYRTDWSDVSLEKEYYKLPAYLVDRASTVTREYPYDNMVCELNSDESATNNPEHLYFTFGKEGSKTGSVDYAYSAYFMGPLSINYKYTDKRYSYIQSPSTATELNDITAKNILTARPVGKDKSIYDISFATSMNISSEDETIDINSLSFDNRISKYMVYDHPDFGDDAGTENQTGKLNPSARAVVLPVTSYELNDGTIDVGTGLPTDLSYDSGSTTITPELGDIIVFEKRIYVFDGTNFMNPPSAYGYGVMSIDFASNDTWIDSSSENAIYIDVSKSTNRANAHHYAQILAMSNNQKYNFLENYDMEAAPYIDYSISGDDWVELPTEYISEYKFIDNGQRFPNDSRNINKMAIRFVGTQKIDDDLEYGEYNNSIWSQWKWLWEYEAEADPTLIDKYPNLYYGTQMMFETSSLLPTVGETLTGTSSGAVCVVRYTDGDKVCIDLKSGEIGNTEILNGDMGSTVAVTTGTLVGDDIINPSGYFKDNPEDVEDMTDAQWAEFVDWAGSTLPPFLTIDEDGTKLILNPDLDIRLDGVTTKGNLKQAQTNAAIRTSGRADTYFLSGKKFQFGSVPPHNYIVSYLSKRTYQPDVDYVWDNNGIITFINDANQPFGNSEDYSPYKRFILGLDYYYIPEWIDIPTTMVLSGGTSGVYMSEKERYEELVKSLDTIIGDPPDILVPADFYLDDTMEDFSSETGRPYFKNAGLFTILSSWLREVNEEAWTTRAVVPIKGPREYTMGAINDWLRRTLIPSRTSPLTPGSLLPSYDEKWIDIVAGSGIFNSDGINFRVSPQGSYAGMLAVNRLPNLLSYARLPDSFRPLFSITERMLKTAMREGGDPRVMFVMKNTDGSNVISDFITAAAQGSDYSRGLRRELAAETVNVIRTIWNEIAKGKVAEPSRLQMFKQKIDSGVRRINGAQEIKTQIIQTREMKLQNKIRVRVEIVPYGEFIHLEIDLGFSTQGL